MRTGAIFARGSCRALKWMALFGVVFALGAGSAAAQVSIEVPKTVDEAGRLMITVTAKVDIAGPTAAGSTLTVAATVTARTGTGGNTQIVDASKMLSAAEPTGTPGADFTAAAVTVEIPVPENTHATEPIQRTLTGTIVVQTLPDLDAEDEAITVTLGDINAPTGVSDQGPEDTLARAATGSGSPANVTINDTDDQTFEWDAPDQPKESSDIVVKLMTDPVPVDLTHSVPLSIDAAGYTIITMPTAATATLAATTPTATITIDPPDSDGNRDDDTITLRALVAGTTSDLIDPLEIEVADIHKLPADDKITAKAFQDDGKGKKTKNEAMSVMEGGDPVHVTITVDRGDDHPSGEKLKVEVMAADAAQGGDYRVDDDEFLLDTGKGKQSMDIKLWARDDDDVGEEMLMLNLVVSGAKDDNGPGQSMGMFSIMIEDATTPMVSVKDGAYDAIMMALGDDPLNPGAMVEIMTDDLFMVMDGYTASYATSIEGSAVSGSTSGDKVMLNAEDDGEAKVTVTATATPMSDSLIITQDRANVAQVTFPVMVELKELMIMLSGPEDMNVAEGMSYDIMAEANRPVEKDTMVELVQTDGTASPSDYEVGSITIMAGEMMGSTMLMATEDDMMEEGEMLTLEGRFADDQDGDTVKTNAVMFYLWDAAVPALPIIAQLLLAAFLALGGYRRYLRR